jgi:S-adenosylmethionine synthetase
MKENRYLFTSESVGEGHPDKLCDQISDAVLDACLANDASSHVACETFASAGMVLIGGEITTNDYIPIDEIARNVAREIGYTDPDFGLDYKSMAVMNMIHSQSPDINQGVVGKGLKEYEGQQGAGDQGMMFGFACSETPELMPAPIMYSHNLLRKATELRKNKTLPWLRPDAKSQVTIEYEGHKPVRIDTVVISHQHNPDVSDKDIKEGIIEQIIKPVLTPTGLLDKDTKYFINPTGRFVIGGPFGDTGLTGRKIIVDTYGGMGRHGGGAFSGKDPSKVDRSAAYAARWIAKNMVAAGVAKEMLVQISYAIGVAQPVSVCVNTYGTAKVALSDGEIAKKVSEMFDLRPQGIIEALKLKQPMYEETARYGHMGRTNEVVKKQFVDNGQVIEREVELFTWEKLDKVAEIKQVFGL